MFKLMLALMFAMTLLANAAFACPGCMTPPELPVKQEVKTYEWHMQLNFEARIRWTDENWQKQAAAVIEKLEALDSVVSAKAGTAGQIILQLTEDAFEVKSRRADRCGSPPLVYWAEFKLEDEFTDAVKPIFEDDALPLKSLSFVMRSALPKPKAPADE